MNPDTTKQLKVLGLLLAAFASLTFVAYVFIPAAQTNPAAPEGTAITMSPRLAVGVAAIVFVVYGALGLAGFWFARRLALPTVYQEGASARDWVLRPALIGLGAGIVLVVGDLAFVAAGRPDVILHPAFPLSLIASATAGIGEEILFRGFLLGLWGFLLNLVLRRWNATRLAAWLGVVLAALAFSAIHLPGAMLLLGAASPADLPPLLLAELVLLNTFLGIVAGEQYLRYGLVAAVGVHFWADIVWHVVWPLLSGGA
jgi:membrane protease YdiL (CAAX protease family)